MMSTNSTSAPAGIIPQRRRRRTTTSAVIPGGGWMRTVRWADGTVTTEPVVAWSIDVIVYDDDDTAAVGVALDVDVDTGTIDVDRYELGARLLYWHPDRDAPQWVLDRLDTEAL